MSIDESVAGNAYKGNGAAQFFLIWTESGGAPVAKPTRKGFGSVNAVHHRNNKRISSAPPIEFSFACLAIST
jgi:two-component sensor histidine kinase